MQDSVMDKIKGNDELLAEAKLFFETYKKEVGESIRKGRRVVFVSFSGAVVHKII